MVITTKLNGHEVTRSEHNDNYNAKQVIIQYQTTEIIDLYMEHQILILLKTLFFIMSKDIFINSIFHFFITEIKKY